MFSVGLDVLDHYGKVGEPVLEGPLVILVSKTLASFHRVVEDN
jgi:hypothetical protein